MSDVNEYINDLPQADISIADRNRSTVPEKLNISELFKDWKGFKDIKHHGLYKNFNMYTYRDTDDGLLSVCPELNIFMNEIEDEYNDSENIIIDELKNLIDVNIRLSKKIGSKKNLSWMLGRYVYF